MRDIFLMALGNEWCTTDVQLILPQCPLDRAKAMKLSGVPGLTHKALESNVKLDVLSLKSLEINAKMNMFITEVKGKADILDT